MRLVEGNRVNRSGPYPAAVSATHTGMRECQLVPLDECEDQGSCAGHLSVVDHWTTLRKGGRAAQHMQRGDTG